MIYFSLKERTNAAKGCFKAYEELRVGKMKEEVRAQMLRDLVINEEIERANRKRIVKTLEIDSTNWFFPENIDNKLETHIIVPDVTESQNDYYRRLQEVKIHNMTLSWINDINITELN